MPIGYIRRPISEKWDEVVMTVPRDNPRPPYLSLQGQAAARCINSVMFGYVSSAAEVFEDRDTVARLSVLRKQYDARIVRLYDTSHKG